MYKHLPSPVNFREDINGLRAWAVIAVLLFHFSLIGLPGGFVGVDIFFVILGYLMTAIVITKIEKANFSILDFYMARIRRILPALLALRWASKNCGIELLRTESFLCDSSNCFGSRNLKPLYYDNSHLSEDGNKLLTPMFEKIFASK